MAGRLAAGRSLLIIAAWIPITLFLDTGASVVQQWLLGLVTTGLLIALSMTQPVLVRWQVVIVVVFATVVELVFSGWLGVYEYRLGAVPAYVPAGHGLVYLAALDFGQWGWAQRHAKPLVRGTVVVVVVVALYALAGTRQDVLGAFWALCLLGFLRWGRAPLLFVGAFWVVTWLEVLGTRWGVWTWQPYDTIVGWVPMGNPPSVAAGGYGWFDLVAVAGAGWLAARLQPWASRLRTASWSRPLVVTAEVPDSTGSPDQVVMTPPASRTTGTSAAMSHRLSSGSQAMSTQPSATITCDQKSP
jgi:hypothetical protein